MGLNNPQTESDHVVPRKPLGVDSPKVGHNNRLLRHRTQNIVHPNCHSGGRHGDNTSRKSYTSNRIHTCTDVKLLIN